MFEILEESDDVFRANFYFFLSGRYFYYFLGSLKVPVGGFEAAPIKLKKISNKNKLPVSHTCYSLLDLPDYQNKEELLKKLIICTSEGIGFEIAWNLLENLRI